MHCWVLGFAFEIILGVVDIQFRFRSILIYGDF